MLRPRGIAIDLFLLAGLFLPSFAQSASVRRVQVLGSKDAVEIEIEASDRLIPQTQVLTGPDRLVVDFPNAMPGAQLRSQSVDRGEIKSVRVGLFQSNPPITRVVFDLKSPQSYQVFPSGRTVMIKVTAPPEEAEGVDYFAPVTRPGLVNTSFPAKPSLDVSYHDGLLSIRANRASLADVLLAVHQRTGAEVAVAAGAEQEQVVADINPAPASDVLARLLNGSRFNFLILNSASDPRILDRVILTARGEGAFTAPPLMRGSSDDADDGVPQPAVGAQAPPMRLPQPAIAQVPVAQTPVPQVPVAGVPPNREIPPGAAPEDREPPDNDPD